MKAVSSMVTAMILVTLSFVASADWKIDTGLLAEDDQDIVITISRTPAYPVGNTYKVDPENLEEVCLALTMARMLQQSHNVTVFMRNDGVYLVDEGMLDFISERQPSDPSKLNGTDLQPCIMPDEDGMQHPYDLKDHLDAFLDGDDNNLVNCPICAGARGFINPMTGVSEGDYPYAGILPIPSDPDWSTIKTAIPSMLMGADKVIDF